MPTLVTVIVMVVVLLLARQVSAWGDAVIADILAVAVAVYLWREGIKGGSLALVGLLAGLLLLGMAAASTLDDRTAGRWASTPGTVGWAATTCHASVSLHRWYEAPEPATICISPMYYRYRVGDRDYAGTRVTFNDLLLSDLEWNWEAKYEDNRHVTVLYDPADPAVAVLERRTPGQSLLWVAGLLFTFGLGHAFLTNRGDAAEVS